MKNSDSFVHASFSVEKCNAYSKLELVDKIRTDHLWTTLYNCRQERGLLHGSLRLAHTLPRTGLGICCENSFYRVGNLYSTDTRVCRSCTDHQHNRSGRRNLWLRSEMCTERLFRMGLDRKSVVVAPHLVRLWNFK